MSRNALLVTALVGLTAVIVVAVGVAMTSGTADLDPDPALYVDREEYEHLKDRHRKLSELAAKTKAQKSRLSDRARALESRVAELTTELERQQVVAEQSAEKELGAAASNLPVAFGEWADLDAIRNADWSEMGEAVQEMNALILELYESIEKGETPDAGLQDKIREENNKLVRYAAQVMGKIPTNSPINGEFSHPITLANLIGSMLENEALPLSSEQKESIARLGGDYEAEWSELQSTYGESTPRLEKLIDELELKRDTMRDMENVLSDEQRGAVIVPAIHDRLQLDPLSPATMAVMLARPKNVSSLEELRSRLPGYFSEWFGVSEKDTEALAGIADAWMEDMKPLLTPVRKPEKFLHLDRTIAAGRAEVNAMKRLLNLPELDESVRKAIEGHLGWRVPQVVEKSPE